MELYVVRHGQTIVNIKGLVNARNIIGINKKGREQAEIAAKQLENIPIDLIICSPLRRTKQTCKIINKKKIKVIYDKRILERNARSMQFKKVEKIDMKEWYDISKSQIYKNTEGFKSILERIKQFLEQTKEKYPNKKVLIVTHGDVCKAIYAYMNNISDPDEIDSCEQDNCEIRKYDII